MRRVRIIGAAVAVVLAAGLTACGTPGWKSQLLNTNAAGTDSGNGPSGSLGSAGYSDDPNSAAFVPGTTKVAYMTTSNDVGPEDPDIYLRDLATGGVELLSTGDPDCEYEFPVASPDGTKVAFTARGLLAACDHGVYVRDLASGVLTLVSASTTGAPVPADEAVFSPDSTKVAFVSQQGGFGPPDSNAGNDVYIRDLVSGTIVLVSANSAGTNGGNGGSVGPVFTPDGAKLMFSSGASNLGPTDANQLGDLYLRDLSAGTTSLISVKADGTQAGNGTSFFGSLSGDGRFVVFESSAGDLTGIGTSGSFNVFVRDLQTGVTSLVSVNTAGTGGGNGRSTNPSISPDGRWAAWSSTATDLSPLDRGSTSDVFVRDLVNGTTTVASLNAGGTSGGNGRSWAAHGKAFGTSSIKVLFQSEARNLGPTDSNFSADVYERDLVTGTTSLVSANSGGTDSGNSWAELPSYAPDGCRVAYTTRASNLGSTDTNGFADVYISTC